VRIGEDTRDDVHDSDAAVVRVVCGLELFYRPLSPLRHHPSPSVSIRQLPSASMRIREHTRAYVFYLKPGHEEESEGQAMGHDDQSRVGLYVIPSQRADQQTTSHQQSTSQVSIREHT
jgi:hypothetical protein